MLLHNTPSSYGRLVPKPEKLVSGQVLYDDNVSVQDQIENLRVKISLKERYNKVLKDELEESRQGASTIIHDLYNETRFLRTQFIDAVNLEKSTVQKAMRTHRHFQVAMKGRVTTEAIPWLDDKLFDMGKRLNQLLHCLYHKRKRLEDIETVVHTMERWPRPGSLPWEMKVTEKFHQIEYDIENMKVKLETASILHTKYHEIKFILREEKGKYSPVLRTLENQLSNQRKELDQLKKMLADAVIFQNEANKKLAITEVEAAENRRRRKKQMAKMKKAVQKILDANQMAVSGTHKEGGLNRSSYTVGEGDRANITEENEVLRLKKLEVERYQDRTRRIVEAMKVPDLTFIPSRYQTVMDLGRRFEVEQKAKHDLRNLLLRQQNMLNLILCHFLYTGQREEAEFFDKKRVYEDRLREVEAGMVACRSKMEKYGSLIVDVRLAMLVMIEKFDDTNKFRRRFANSELIVQIKILRKKVADLVESVALLERQIPEEDAADPRNFAQYIKTPVVPNRLVRVGTPVRDDDSDGDEDYSDLKVPGRLDIKAKSLRFMNQAKLKRGIGI